jgi:hypothetical protein
MRIPCELPRAGSGKTHTAYGPAQAAAAARWWDDLAGVRAVGEELAVAGDGDGDGSVRGSLCSVDDGSPLGLVRL